MHHDSEQGNDCKYCGFPIPSNKVMCTSAECRREHNTQNALARWSRATESDRKRTAVNMNAVKSPATRKEISRIAGVASGRTRQKKAKQKKGLTAELIQIIVNHCYDAPFTLTKSGRILPTPSRNRLVLAGRAAAKNNIERLPDKLNDENEGLKLRSKDEIKFAEIMVKYGHDVIPNEHMTSLDGKDRTLKYLHYGIPLTWNPDFTLEVPRQRKIQRKTGPWMRAYEEILEDLPEKREVYVETKGLSWVREYERRFRDNRRKLPERLYYLEKFRDSVLKLYERFAINVRLAENGLQPPVYWMDAKHVAFIELTHYWPLITELRAQTGYFYEDIYRWMETYFFYELEMIDGAVIDSWDLDLSSEQAALDDIRRRLEWEYASVSEQSKRLNWLAKQYFKTAVSFYGTEIKQLLLDCQSAFNVKHNTSFQIA